MIILDTNVVSEPLRLRPDLNVIAWLDRQDSETLFLTATSLSELLVGVELLPVEKRKQELHDSVAELVLRLFGSRILPFDERAAIAYATLFGRARGQGKPPAVGDTQIAAIAYVRGFSVASRDSNPFLTAGVTLINPWQEVLQ